MMTLLGKWFGPHDELRALWNLAKFQDVILRPG
jgi:hypothetical protein